jgi:hypothetical protein
MSLLKYGDAHLLGILFLATTATATAILLVISLMYHLLYITYYLKAAALLLNALERKRVNSRPA